MEGRGKEKQPRLYRKIADEQTDTAPSQAGGARGGGDVLKEEAPLVVSTIRTTQRKEHHMSKAVLGLSVTQIIIGGLCIILQLVLFSLQLPVLFVGQGIQTGAFFCLTGLFGIVSSKTKSSCYIVTFLTLAITSALLTVRILVASSIDMILIVIYLDEDPVLEKLATGISGALIILAVIEAVVAIISAAFSCHSLCGGNQNQVVVAGQVQNVQGPDGQQQMVILTFNQQGVGVPAGPGSNPDQTKLPAYNQLPPPIYGDEMKLPILSERKPEKEILYLLTT